MNYWLVAPFMTKKSIVMHMALCKYRAAIFQLAKCKHGFQ